MAVKPSKAISSTPSPRSLDQGCSCVPQRPPIWPTKTSIGAIRAWTLAVALADFVLSLPLWFQFNPADGGMQFTERVSWVPSLGISYLLGIDGISLFLVLLTTFLTVICILSSWSIVKGVKEYMFFFLALETGMLGALVSLDLFLFYVFWEAMLIPMALLIGAVALIAAPSSKGLSHLKYYDQLPGIVEPVAERLVSEIHNTLGADWAERWSEGLPQCFQVPGEVNVIEILRLWTYAKALDLKEWGKMRYNLLGQADHWLLRLNRCFLAGLVLCI